MVKIHLSYIVPLFYLEAVIRAALPSKSEVSEVTTKGGLRGKLKKVVLAYSGGLDTSVIVPWLRFSEIHL